MKKTLKWLFPLVLVVAFGATVLAGDITDKGMSQKDLHKLLRNMVTAMNSGALGNAGLTSGTTTSAYVKTANSISFAVDGLLYTKAATDNIAISAAAQTDNTYCMYLLTLNSSGTVSATKGTEKTTDTAILPDVPSSAAPFGALKVVTTTPSFVLGTTSLTATGVTTTFYNIRSMPSGNYKVSLTGL